jgi:hypothetical protein
MVSVKKVATPELHQRLGLAPRPGLGAVIAGSLCAIEPAVAGTAGDGRLGCGGSPDLFPRNEARAATGLGARMPTQVVTAPGTISRLVACNYGGSCSRTSDAGTLSASRASFGARRIFDGAETAAQALASLVDGFLC